MASAILHYIFVQIPNLPYCDHCGLVAGSAFHADSSLGPRDDDNTDAGKHGVMRHSAGSYATGHKQQQPGTLAASRGMPMLAVLTYVKQACVLW